LKTTLDYSTRIKVN